MAGSNVASWYKTNLGRDADAEGLNYWENQIKLSQDPNKVFQDFKTAATGAGATWNEPTASPGLIQRQFDTGATRKADQNYTNPYAGINAGSGTFADKVSNFYLNSAGRAPDQEGFDYWMNEARLLGEDKAFANLQTAMNAHPEYAGYTSATKPMASATSTSAELWSPTTRSVTNDELVEHRLTGLLNRDNPYISQARSRSMDESNRRGLLNSSIAMGAAEGAAIERALPIAQQDASTYATQGLTNQQAQNTAGQFNTGEANKFSMSRLQNQQDIGKMNLQHTQDIEKLNLDATNKTSLANIEANYKTLMQASASASDVWKTTIAAINDIQTNKDMPPETKNAAVQQQLDLARASLALIGGMNALDLEGLLDFSAISPIPATPASDPEAAPVDTGYGR